MIYKNIAQGDVFDLKSFILGTLDFTGSNYSWYIEMYIGLFLLAPFLNLAYGKLKSKKQKQVLLVTAVFLTIIPSLFNIFNFGSLDWWTNPTSSDEFQKLVPSWWQGFYPVAYYFVGCYIREYGLKMKTRTMLVLFVFHFSYSAHSIISEATAQHSNRAHTFIGTDLNRLFYLYCFSLN